VSVHELPNEEARARIAPILQKLTASGLEKSGLAVTKSETISIQGERAPRLLGVANGPGTVRRGENVTVLHGNRLYVITALQVSEMEPGKLEASFTKFLASFRFR
jgi:hypothetical protein